MGLQDIFDRSRLICRFRLIAFFQAKRQLVSSLIPEKAILQVIQPDFYTASILTCTFIISIWLYFFRRRVLKVAYPLLCTNLP